MELERPETAARYVLVKSYYGLGGDLCVLLGAMRYAQQTRRTLLADWSGGFYGSVADGRLLHALFDSPRFETSAALPAQPLSVFPSVWQDRLQLPPMSYLSGQELTLSRPEEAPLDCPADCVVITRDSKRLTRQPEQFHPVARRLQPVRAVRDAVAREAAQWIPKAPSIGIHYRHGNGERKVVPPDPRWFRNRINARLRMLDRGPNEFSLFVATDCRGAVDYFRRYYPNTFACEKPYRPNGAGAMHVGREDLDDAARMQAAHEALIDMYTLAECDWFIGSRGFFSLFVKLLRGRRHTMLYEGARLFNDYCFTDRYGPAEADPVMGLALRQARQTVDGLFVRLEADRRRLVYYDEPIYDVPAELTSLAVDQVQEMRRAVIARRTY